MSDKSKNPVMVMMIIVMMMMMIMTLMVMTTTKAVHISTDIRRGTCSPCIRFLLSSSHRYSKFMMMIMMMTMTMMMTTVLMRTKSRLPRRTVTRTVDAKNSIRRILEAKSISTSFLFFQPVEDNRTDTRDDDNNKPEKLPHTGEVFSTFRILSNVGMLNADIRIG